MAAVRDVMLLLVYFLVSVRKSDCSCTFPADLRGVWISAQKGVLRFNDSIIAGYPVKIPNLAYLDLKCTDISGSQYLLSSFQTTVIFGQKVRLFLCLDINEADDNFVYYLGTKYEAFLKEYLYGNNNDSVAITQVCNRQQPYDPGSAIMLVKNVSSIGDLDNITCPQSVLSNFSGVILSNTNGSEHCPGNVVDACDDNSLLKLSLNSSCSTMFSIENMELICIHYTNGNGVLYLYTYLNNDVIAASKYGFICIEIKSISNGLTMEIYPEFCSDLMTSTSLITLQLSSQGTCSRDEGGNVTEKPTKTESRSILVYYAVASVVVFCILVALFTTLYLCRKKFCFQCRLAPGPSQLDHDFTDMNDRKF